MVPLTDLKKFRCVHSSSLVAGSSSTINPASCDADSFKEQRSIFRLVIKRNGLIASRFCAFSNCLSVDVLSAHLSRHQRPFQECRRSNAKNISSVLT